MSEVGPCLLQTGDSEDHHSGKLLHKQMEVMNDDKDVVGTGEAGGSGTTISTDGNMNTNMHVTNGSSANDSQSGEVITSFSARNKTLIRGQTIEEGTSPPPESSIGQAPYQKSIPNGHLSANELATDSGEKIGKIKGDDAKDLLLTSHKISSDSGHGTMDDASDTSVLSRDSSLENTSTGDMYKDATGVDIPNFIKETLMKSLKDKKTVLSLEDQLLNFVHNGLQMYKLPDMTSYERMILHRLAAFLGVEHNVDSSGKCIILSRTEITRCVKLTDILLCEDSRETKKKILLKKQPASFDERNSRGNNKQQFGSHRAKSLEERQQNYNEARERIFKDGENQCEEDEKSNNFLTVDFVPHVVQQLSQQDIATNSSQQPLSKWTSGDSGCHGLHKEPSVINCNSESSVISYNPTPTQSNSQVPGLASVSGDIHPHNSSSGTQDAGPSIVTQLPTHGQTNGLFYHFDTTCPPPVLMAQPDVLPPTGSISYHNDSLPDMSAKFGAISLGTAEQGSETYAVGIPGQVVPIMFHPQALYPPTFPSHIPQGQLVMATSPVGIQQPVKYVTIPYPGQQFIHQTTVDKQGQTTVPMPTVGISAIQGPSNFQMMNTPYQPPIAVANPSQCIDMNSVAYHYRAVSEMVVPNGGGGLSLSTASGPPHLVLAYAQPHQQHSPAMVGHLPQFVPSGIAPSGTAYYTIPVANSPAPHSLTSPPSSHHESQHLQPAILYTSGIGNPLTYQHSPPSSSSSSLKAVQSPLFTTQPQHSSQPVVVSPTAGYQPPHLALSYNHPTKSGAPPSHAPHFMALRTNPYQIQPVGPTVFHLATGTVGQTPHLGSSLQLQPYQIVRPSGTISDMRLVNSNSIRSGLSPLQITSNPGHPNQYCPPKKQLKKLPHSGDDNQGSHGLSTVQQQQLGHMNVISPLNVSSSIHQMFGHIPPYSSNRQ